MYIVCYIIHTYDKNINFSLFLLLTILVTSSPPAATNPLDGCVYLYLDMGTNVGVQIRWPLTSRCGRVGVEIDDVSENCLSQRSFLVPQLKTSSKNISSTATIAETFNPQR